MKAISLLFFCILLTSVKAQQVTNLISLEPDKKFENVLVKPLLSDSLASSFIIWIRKEVKAHKHLEHSETIYVLEGSGKMTVGEKIMDIKAGDYFNIPVNTPHAVSVTSDTPLKVISIQAPFFDGKDRVFLD